MTKQKKVQVKCRCKSPKNIEERILFLEKAIKNILIYAHGPMNRKLLEELS